MGGTVLGRLLVGVSSSAASGDIEDQNTRIIYRSIYDFLKTQAEPAGYVTEIARLGNQFTASNGDFSVWRWNTSSLRNWEWYMLIQESEFNFGSVTSSAEPGQINGFGIASVTACGVAAAVGIQHETGSYDFFNPWNGTTNLNDFDSKGSPVWSTSSADPGKDVHLAVVPRANISGSSINTNVGDDSAWTNLDAMSYLGIDTNPGNGGIGYIYADEDSFFTVWRDASAGEATVHDHISTFVGTYKPLPSLSASIPAPLCLYHVGTGEEPFPENNNLTSIIGQHTNGVVSVFPMTGTISDAASFKSTCGGMFAPIIHFNFLPDKQMQIATGTTSSVYPSPPVFVWRNEHPYGLIGMFDSPLFRIIKDVGGNEFRYATTNSGSSGLRRAFLPADTNSEGENSYSVFWSGSFLPGTGSIAVSASISGAVRF